MSLVQPYTQEDRASTRRLIKQLESYSRELDSMLRGREPVDQVLVSALHAITDTPDIENQIKALDAMVAARRRTHIEHLTKLAPDDLTAFAEVLNPNEPPAKHHIYLSERLQEVERGDRDRLMLSMPPGHAKDLCVDTSVMMASGVWKRLGDIEVGDEVIAGTGKPQEVLAVHDQGVRPVLRITTKSGRVVIAHPEHQFLTPSGWTEAQDLLPGSALTQPRVILPFVSPERSRAEFVFAGYMVARAVVTGRSYSRLQRITAKFRCDDPAILADITAMGHRLGFRAERAKEDVRGRVAALLRFDPACVAWLKAAGLHGLDKRTMRLPDWVFQGSDGDTAAFLGAIVSCDATFVPQVSKQTGAQRKLWFQVRNNAGLADDIARLFFRLGINVHRRVSRCTNYNYDHAEFHRMEVPDADDQALIGRRLRIIGSTKRFWAMPISGGGWGNEAFRADPVDTIEPFGSRETRCITVENEASFVANGIVVHNSTYCSRYYPAWYLGKSENRIYLQAGWGQTFAEKEFGRKTKDIICSPAFASVFPASAGVRFDAKANGDWIMGNGNRYVTKGAGEGISGFRSTNNAVDDPYKSFEQAQSALQREKLWDWFTNDFMTRLLPQGNAFIIMTRWHVDDLIGRLSDMASRGDIKQKWDYLNIPVFCEETDPNLDPLRRNYGEEIWPDFYSKAVLLRHKEISSQSNWDCLYRGQPQPADGNIIKKEWIAERYRVPPLLKWDKGKAGDPAEVPTANQASTVGQEGNPPSEPDRDSIPTPAGDSPLYRRTVISVDSAEKETQRADFTAITVWRESILGHHYLVDAHIERMEFPKLVERIGQYAEQWNADFVLMEEKGAGNQYIQHMKAEKDVPFVVVGINPGRDGKQFRMDSVTPIFMQKRVILPHRAPWLEVFERELLQFPGGKHDDYPDSVSQYLKWARDTGMVRRGSKKMGGIGHARSGGRRHVR